MKKAELSTQGGVALFTWGSAFSDLISTLCFSDVPREKKSIILPLLEAIIACLTLFHSCFFFMELAVVVCT